MIRVACCLVTKKVENKISWNVNLRSNFKGAASTGSPWVGGYEGVYARRLVSLIRKLENLDVISFSSWKHTKQNLVMKSLCNRELLSSWKTEYFSRFKMLIFLLSPVAIVFFIESGTPRISNVIERMKDNRCSLCF